MKTILVLLLITGISVCSLAQNEKPINKFQEKEFNDKLQTDTIEYFKISPLFKTDTVIRDFQYSQKLQTDPFQINKPDSLFSFQNSPKYELRMPVAGGGMHLNMPIAVPDSSVHYYIKDKRIEFINPLDRNRK